jgi:hypothetical protein
MLRAIDHVQIARNLPSPWRGEGGPAEQGRMGVGDCRLQKPALFERGPQAQQRGGGATPNPGPSPLQGEGGVNPRRSGC